MTPSRKKRVVRFTDKDLKRFKSWIDDCYESDKFYCRTSEIEALIARMEAAELCLEIPHMKHTEGNDDMECTFCSRYKAWRKVTGK